MCIRLFFILVLATLQTSMPTAQTGGSYDLSHSVIASGGGTTSQGGTFTIGGTVGQPIAGVQSAGGAFNVRGGFWPVHQFAPTAAGVSVGGRVMTAEGLGISSVIITLTNLSTGEMRTALSSSFGYYRFDDVLAGQFYSVTVQSKRHGFDPDTQTFNLIDELTQLDFTATVQ
jgi:hypothetical protein